MSSHRALRDVVDQYYGPLRQPAGTAPVAWVSAFAPVEILRAMGLACFYPESYAATCSARGLGREMISVSSQRGLGRDVCSYARIFYGAVWDGLGPLGSLPRPDLLIATNNQCGTIPAWWESLQESYGVPLFTVDYPREQEGLTPETLEYIRLQHRGVVDIARQVSGADLDPDVLARVVGLSRRASDAWSRILELRARPRFQGEVRTMIDALFPIVVLRGTEACAHYYEVLYAEMARKPEGDAVRPRILWYGYPCWFLPGRVILPRVKRGRIVADTYTRWWVFDFQSADVWEGLSRVYGLTYLNRSPAEKVREVEALVSEYDIDAVLIHSNRSCKRVASAENLVLQRLENLGIPSVRFEGDMADPTWHGGGSAEACVSALLEILGN